MLDAILHAALLWLAALAGAAALWPARRWDAGGRGLLLTAFAAGLFLLPWLQPRDPFGPFLFVACVSLILVLKVRDFHVGAHWWSTQPFHAWLRFLPMPFILVLRRHVNEEPRPLATNVRMLLRGAVEIAAGVWILHHASDWNLVDVSPWLDHTVRVLAAYGIAFDGGMAFLCALHRLLGVHVMTFSRHPILSVSPADFWRRYNRPGGRFLYENVFRQAGGRRAPLRATLLTFTVNGVLHEYMAFILVQRVQGYQIAFFLIHGIAVALTFRLRPRGPLAVLCVAGTFLFVVATSALFFATLENTAPGWLYPRGALLP